jgi:LCP family protein required for cell wall assembly
MSRYDDTDSAGWRRPPGRRRRRTGGSRKHSRTTLIAGSLAILATSALVLGSLYAYVRYRVVWDSIKRINVAADLIKRPPGYGHALNILVIGSDSRSGQNGAIGGRVASGQRSDTVMVVHISPTLHHVVALSFPRDSAVPTFGCAAEPGDRGQRAVPGQYEQLNSTFAYGGPGCLWHTIEQTTHIRLNDFIELDFTGFVKVINDLGGVDVCLPQAVNDHMSGLNLKKGRQHIWGKQALAFWRTREDLGLGSDLQRIRRDQFLMIALLHGILKSGLLGSPTRMATVITDTARAMTTDSGLNVGRMLQIAGGLRGLSAKSTEFIEVPAQTYLPDPDWVQWSPQDTSLFAAIAHDTRVPPVKTLKAGRPGTLLAMSGVKVEVLNGSGVPGIASATADGLRERGFAVAGRSANASNFSYTRSVVEYGSPAAKTVARAVQAQLSNATLQLNQSLPPGRVDLILGSSFTGLQPKARAQRQAASVASLSKTYGGLTGDVNVCNDKSAFAGPDGS